MLVSDSCASTSDRSSSWPITSPRALGLPPSSRTNRSDDRPSSQTTGREQPGQHGQRAGPGQRDLLAALQPEPLGRELAEDQRAERDDQRDADQGDRLGHRRFHAEPDQPGGDVLRHGRRAERGGQHGRDGDADLHGGQELGRVGHQLLQPLPVASPGRGQVLDLAFPQRDHRDLGRVEDAADHDEHQDDDDVPDQFAHRRNRRRVGGGTAAIGRRSGARSADPGLAGGGSTVLDATRTDARAVPSTVAADRQAMSSSGRSSSA